MKSLVVKRSIINRHKITNGMLRITAATVTPKFLVQGGATLNVVDARDYERMRRHPRLKRCSSRPELH
jgi:uncharacterized membrane protein YdbT with pleckstrin-like domain